MSATINTQDVTELERPTLLGQYDPQCPGCHDADGSPAIGRFGPSHKPSGLCRSGKRPHCSCDTCF